MSAALREGTLHTFDLRDFRAPSVKRVWLDNMHFHAGDVFLTDDEGNHVGVVRTVIQEVRRADLLLVDHVDRLGFIVHIASWLKVLRCSLGLPP